VRAASDGIPGAVLAEQIEQRFGIAERHARLIARDQIGKLEAKLTQARCQEMGIASYDWISLLVGKNRRREHVARHGRRFRYDSPPADGHPGFAICCQCRQMPAWDELRAQLDTPSWQAALR
jgi:SPP1 gp7 family putative phage head morphogenesis protein